MTLRGGIGSPGSPLIPRHRRVFRTVPSLAVASAPVPDRATSRRGRPRGRALRRAALAVLLAAAALAGCRNQGTQTPKFLGDVRDLDAERVDPAFREDWAALEQARKSDPAAQDTREIADRLLAREPPIPVRLAAYRAKAEHAYLSGDDPLAIAVADEALALVEVDPARPPVVVVDLQATRARALARGGDPSTALAALEGPILAPEGRLSADERLGLRAVALDRDANHPAAVAAYARWRETLDDSDPTSAWVEHRLGVLAAALDDDGFRAALEDMPASPARTCLEARAGTRVTVGSGDASLPAWVKRCGPSAGAVGLLLPRSGKLSALSDVHLAAVVTTVDVLGAGGAPLLFRDAGSSKGEARAAVEALLSEGVRVIVGPVGAANVDEVVETVGQRATVVVPGEARAPAIGIAPTLERRVRRLVEHATAAGKTRLVVLAPDNAYGKRAIEAAKKAGGKLAGSAVVKQYPSGTTSFQPVLSPVMTSLQPSTAVLVADHLPRTEMLVRQLLRSGKMPARGSAAGMMVMTTAEGTDPKIVSDAPDVFEGVWASPVAAAVGPEAEAFAATFIAHQGVAPDDQALLVYYAMRRALTGAPQTDPGPAPLVRFEEGRVVVQGPTSN
jgi:ABC-type branched-subunit amino acid transport system substrate-binding protein